MRGGGYTLEEMRLAAKEQELDIKTKNLQGHDRDLLKEQCD